MRNEYAANEALNVGMAYVSRQAEIVKTQKHTGARLSLGYNGKAGAVALGLMAAGVYMQSAGCLGLACLVLAFGIRPYWR